MAFLPGYKVPIVAQQKLLGVLPFELSHDPFKPAPRFTSARGRLIIAAGEIKAAVQEVKHIGETAIHWTVAPDDLAKLQRKFAAPG